VPIVLTSGSLSHQPVCWW